VFAFTYDDDNDDDDDDEDDEDDEDDDGHTTIYLSIHLFTFCRQQRLDGTAYECDYEGYRTYHINYQFDSICYWETTHTELLPRLQGRDQDLQLVDLIFSLSWCTRKSCIM